MFTAFVHLSSARSRADVSQLRVDTRAEFRLKENLIYLSDLIFNLLRTSRVYFGSQPSKITFVSLQLQGLFD